MMVTGFSDYERRVEELVELLLSLTNLPTLLH